jgi:hypothetical protein
MKINFPIQSRNDPISRFYHFLCHLGITEIIMVLKAPSPQVEEEDKKAPSEKGNERPSI